MSLTATDIAAYIGAAAWFPPIIYWIHSWLIKPTVQIVPEEKIELGFTTYGPIFNIRLAISATKRDAIIERLWVDLRHEAGEMRRLTWTGMRETFSEITDGAGNRQLVERDEPAIALKVTTFLLTEKFVRFQDLDFQKRLRPHASALLEHANYLKEQELDLYEAILASREFFAFLEFYKSNYWWKPGRYEVSFGVEGRDDVRIEANLFSFELMQYDIDAFRSNLDLLKLDFENTVKMQIPGYQLKPVPWIWRNVPLVKG